MCWFITSITGIAILATLWLQLVTWQLQTLDIEWYFSWQDITETVKVKECRFQVVPVRLAWWQQVLLLHRTMYTRVPSPESQVKCPWAFAKGTP